MFFSMSNEKYFENNLLIWESKVLLGASISDELFCLRNSFFLSGCVIKRIYPMLGYISSVFFQIVSLPLFLFTLPI